ncbi:MAG TPA: hypothetical protein VHC92_11985 [Rhodanobacteraceae bacterium]|nr:hypothetical protein [Rhodanobacteraceae bacterium]
MKRFAFLAPATFAVAASFATGAHAQWSTDPNANLVVADGANEQVQPKMAATADGGFYISWFDNSTGGYDVRLQRLDAGGNELWPHNGVLVADRDESSTQDYGLAVDADGNALLAFGYTDDGGVLQVLAQKVAPDGTLLWGDPGIFVSADAGGANSPRIAATGDGAAVAWSGSEGEVVIAKLDGDGSPLWVPNVTVTGPQLYAVGGLSGDADGNVIASWIVLNFTSPHAMYAQKFASVDGANLWGDDPVTIEDATDGSLQFGNFPPFIDDGAGGAVFVWYTVGDVGEVHAQHIDATGTSLFPQNGVLASIDDSQNHFEPDGAYDPATGDIYALWRETDLLTQGQIGVYAQRIDSTGARLWGDGGKVIVPLAPLDQTEMVALPVSGGGMIAAWSSDDYPNPTPLHAARIDADGNYLWPGDIVDFSIEASDSGRLTGALSTQGYAAYAWTAGAATLEGDIHAQNINMDGTLGYVDTDTIFENGFDPVD